MKNRFLLDEEKINSNIPMVPYKPIVAIKPFMKTLRLEIRKNSSKTIMIENHYQSIDFVPLAIVESFQDMPSLNGIYEVHSNQDMPNQSNIVVDDGNILNNLLSSRVFGFILSVNDKPVKDIYGINDVVKDGLYVPSYFDVDMSKTDTYNCIPKGVLKLTASTRGESLSIATKENSQLSNVDVIKGHKGANDFIQAIELYIKLVANQDELLRLKKETSGILAKHSEILDKLKDHSSDTSSVTGMPPLN